MTLRYYFSVKIHLKTGHLVNTIITPNIMQNYLHIKHWRYFCLLACVNCTQTLSEGEGILREGEKAYTLLFDTCQRDFCFNVSRRNVTGGDRGRFEISLSRKPDHGRTTVLDSAKTTGYIEIR